MFAQNDKDTVGREKGTLWNAANKKARTLRESKVRAQIILNF